VALLAAAARQIEKVCQTIMKAPELLPADVLCGASYIDACKDPTSVTCISCKKLAPDAMTRKK
jgi:hypothetical protein